VDHKGPKALSAQADKLWGLHESPAAVMPVSVELPEVGEGVNAVRAGRGGRG
jgi:hypothetical protein